MDATRRQPRWLNWTSAGFVIAVLLFANSMLLPFAELVHPEDVNPEQVGEPIPGFAVAIMSFTFQAGAHSSGSNGVHETHVDIDTSSVWYTLANLSFLTTLFVGWNLGRRRPITMWAVSVVGLLLGLTAPLIARPDDGSSVILNEYRFIGYWIWIAALALIALGWGSLVRKSGALPAAVSRIRVGVPLFIGQCRQDVSTRWFAVAAGLFAVSLIAPVVGDEVNGAWAIYFLLCLSAFSAVTMFFPHNPYSIWDARALYLALFANLALLTTALRGRKLRPRFAAPMLAVSVLAVVAACIVPANAWEHRHGDSINFIEYRVLGIGYWLWIFSLAFVAVGWGSVVSNQRKMRSAEGTSMSDSSMRQPLTPESRARIRTAILFAFAALFFLVALSAPIVDRFGELVPGTAAFYATFAEGANSILDFVGIGATLDTDEFETDCVVGMIANLTLLANAACGWWAHRRHAMPMFCLSLNGLAAGLIAPWLLLYSRGYARMYAGYWAWIASLAFVAAGWGSVVWNQRQMRNTGIAGGATSSTAQRHHDLDERA